MIGKIAKFVYFDMGFFFRYWFWKIMIHSMGGTIGKRVKFYGGVRIVGNAPGAIRIGDDVRILRGVTMSTTPSGKIHIGSSSHVGESTIIFSDISIQIGDNVIIGPQNIIVDFDHTYASFEIPINQQGINRKEVTIEEDVWISSHCVIIKGVKIGKGAVIGAGSVVNREIPAYSVAAGVPIRVIKKRGYIQKT
ncbi:MAG TPA: DapH/DapD/GlmU-related protein [Thermodesulfobacteriota bacterium]|nr:DapH/DapD/GlmU-related protein [Thermodesulfobacteriota bacterium]